MHKMVQLYNFHKFDLVMDDTQYGPIDYVGFLHREKERILRSNSKRIVEIKESPSDPDKLGLFVDDICLSAYDLNCKHPDGVKANRKIVNA